MVSLPSPLHSAELSTEVVRAAFDELKDIRSRLHASHLVTRCDLGLVLRELRYGPAARRGRQAPIGLVLSGDCVCRDLVVDVLHVATTFLTEHGATITNPPGAVRVHVRKRVHDVLRSYRCARGAQAKPKQVRSNRYGRALPDEEHRAVLGHLVDEAGYSAPLPGGGYLVRRLAERCAAEFGKPVPYYLERVPAMMSTIRRVCDTGARVNVGTRTAPEYVTWYDAYIDRPLGRRPDTAVTSLSDDGAARWGHDQVADPNAQSAFTAVEVRDADPDPDSVVVDTVVRRMSEVSPSAWEAGLRSTLLGLADGGLLPRQRAESLLSDPDGMDDLMSRVQTVIEARGGRVNRG
ncbi:hypothetical protein [Actinokineospora globicatena]|uniref:Uncharacterized protein n=1 Tax=Actinokineospora globicatena TaxID=103729 RepID=A0A9W6QMB6_9PSEU|nr:hypothetical protein [Actinokineospora globicatena]MCP2302894.1 hypothetical protein [Actinokineospora globicatena]GLW78723.1 hypothetical protein Aglo01_32050 [Actinokineospora globicatena]GLW84609.1 hypothetical protein Aglo02_22490 [Actinokineospora globicatena]GLW91192.1 hypothetical protein Aglo03_20080 [Actinokineospora globicatena]